jgi:hypothetical protein
MIAVDFFTVDTVWLQRLYVSTAVIVSADCCATTRWRVSSDYAPHKVTSQQENEQRTCDTEKSSRRSGRLGQSVIAGVIAVSAVDVAYGV